MLEGLFQLMLIVFYKFDIDVKMFVFSIRSDMFITYTLGEQLMELN
jgi:hypothetical protein